MKHKRDLQGGNLVGFYGRGSEWRSQPKGNPLLLGPLPPAIIVTVVTMTLVFAESTSA